MAEWSGYGKVHFLHIACPRNGPEYPDGCGASRVQRLDDGPASEARGRRKILGCCFECGEWA